MRPIAMTLFLCSLTLVALTSCNEDASNNTNNSNNTSGIETQVIGTWKLVKEHWQLSNNQDTILTSWSTSAGSYIPPTIEFGSQLSAGWYTGGMDKMGWGGIPSNPFSRGSSGVNSMWSIESSSNRLIGAGYAKYDVVFIDANNMILAQTNFNSQYSYDTLWLEKL